MGLGCTPSVGYRTATLCACVIGIQRLALQLPQLCLCWLAASTPSQVLMAGARALGASARDVLEENCLVSRPHWWDIRWSEGKFPSKSKCKNSGMGNSLLLDSEYSWAGRKLRPRQTVGTSKALCYPPADRVMEQTCRNDRVWHLGTWRQEQLEEAVEALQRLVQRGVCVHSSVFHDVLRRCMEVKDRVLASRIHALAVNSGHKFNAFMDNQMICIYACQRRLDEAMQVFIKVDVPNRYMWASIILAHARHGHPKDAIELYRHMRESPTKPDNHVFVAVLKACAVAKDLSFGKEVHADIMGTAEKPNLFVRNCLVDMYSKCGSLKDARKVFDDLPTRDVVTWNAMITGYEQNGMGQEAISLYERMQGEGETPADAVTFVCLLQACAAVGDLNQGKQLHAQIHERGLDADVVVGTSLVDMYSKCGSLEDAHAVFGTLPVKTVVTWTVMISGYARHGLVQEAFSLYEGMQWEGTVSANAVTFACLLKACASVGVLHFGKQLHAQICERGLDLDAVIGTCLVDMYGKCGSLEDACTVFNNLPSKSVATWTALISAYARDGLGQEALALYERMQYEGINLADAVTFVCLLQACSSIEGLEAGKEIHAEIARVGLQNIDVANALIDMYAKCGSLVDAREVFDNLETRDVITWTSMIGGYAQCGHGQEALALYPIMLHEGFSADAVTFVCLLQACNSVAELAMGRQIHAEISRIGLEDTGLFLANALVGMYCKCGSMFDAQQVFDALPTKDIVTWSALLAGYANQGESELVFELFQKLGQEGLQPNSITFLSVLTVCSHVGLVDKGCAYFETMRRDYGITPTMEHYNCVVDLLGRAGQLEMAVEMVETMPFRPPCAMWRCILGACQKWMNVELGKRAFEQVLSLDENDPSAYTLMSNILESAHLRDEAKEIEVMRVSARAWKTPGQSWWTDIGGVVHTFVVGEGEHLQRQPIFGGLADLFSKIKEEGMYDSVARYTCGRRGCVSTS